MFAEVIDDGNGGLTYRTLAGAASDGLPVGTIIAIHSNVIPAGFLPCTGVTFDTAQFPALYLVLADDHTPDLRECNLVGVGLSSREAITNHDVYTLGQFKNDQVSYSKGVLVSGDSDIDDEGFVVGKRTSGVNVATHGKNYGINYAIKATTGITAIADPEIYEQVVGFITDNYVRDDIINLVNGCLVKYDAESNKYTPIASPSLSNTVLTAVVESSEDWTFNGQNYNAEMDPVVNTETPTETASVGAMTTNFITRDNRTVTHVYDIGSVHLDNHAQATTVPAESVLQSTTTIANNMVYYNDVLYQKDSLWYKVEGFDIDLPVLGKAVSDSALIAALDAETLSSISMSEYVHFDFYDVTGFTSTGFVKTLRPYSASDYEIPASSFLQVTYNVYYGSDFDYVWTSNSNSSGVSFVGTEAEYNVAKLITEGQAGFIPSNSLVILTDKTNKLFGEDR